MSNLPKLSSPLYSVTLPVSGTKVTFRPFMVKEEKAILLARKTSGNPVDMVNTMAAIMQDCVSEPKGFDPYDLSYVDYRFLILKIRNQSKGSDLSGKLKCRHCAHEQLITFDFDEIVTVIRDETLPDRIMLEDEIGIIPKSPSIRDVISLMEDMGLQQDQNFEARIQADPDASFKFLALSIKALFDSDNVYDLTPEEASAYMMEQFNEKHLMAVAEYVQKLPRLRIDLSFNCEKCEKRSEVIVEGDSDFFR